ncbi:MAG: glycosyltransferase family 1 protein [Anaerolineae bacterium]|nr:glycosyltransferase family 4 protein [Anaerolineae bacterium]MCX8067655.1 glycosyltransferase family 4 protein [Anaerolineae bacterium]MDW7991985.1 glycosyltransferase family 1 protein [Anaerolineae bacterium]
MRIGIDARMLAYRRGGISSYIRHLLPALASIDPENDYRVLRHRRDRTRQEVGPNFRRATVWTPCHHRLERWALGMEALRLRLDLLHSPDFIPPAFGARHFVVTIHDLNFLYYPQFQTAESRRYYNGQISWAVSHADHILADSEATRTDLIRLLNVPPQKVTTVYLGVGPAFRPLPPEVVQGTLARYGLAPGYLLFVGTLEPRKNLPGLLTAYRILLSRGTTREPLVVVGSRGWLYEDVFARVEALGLEFSVRFLEDVPDGDLPALYSGATLLAMPSFYEGFGLPALEAMACGTPVVLSNRGSLPEIAGGAAVVVNPDSPEDIAAGIAQVLEDPALRETLRARGLARAAQFTWEETARRTLQIYLQVTGGLPR